MYKRQLIDRHSIVDLLLALAGGSTAAPGDATPGAAGVVDAADLDRLTTYEQELVGWLEQHGHTVPMSFGMRVGDIRVPIVYPDHAAVFDLRDPDAAGCADALEDLGWTVVRVRGTDELAKTVPTLPSVFGAGR